MQQPLSAAEVMLALGRIALVNRVPKLLVDDAQIATLGTDDFFIVLLLDRIFFAIFIVLVFHASVYPYGICELFIIRTMVRYSSAHGSPCKKATSLCVSG